MPYLTRVCDHKDKGSTQSISAANALTADFFNKLLSNYEQCGDPVLSTIVPLLPHVRPKFFEDSQALMTGFRKLTFGHGLDYAHTCSALPSQISCWHFLSSLANNSDGLLSPQGLAAPQVTQVLVNFRACIEHIYVNGRDYPNLPEIHQSPVTWSGTFFGGLVMAIHYLIACPRNGSSMGRASQRTTRSGTTPNRGVSSPRGNAHPDV